MATTTFNPADSTTLPSSADRNVRPGFIERFAALFANFHDNEEEHVLARFAGERWCDSTEREMITALSESECSMNW